MAFWERVRRCQNCRKWKSDDPSAPVGTCEHVPDRAPFWTQPITHDTRWDDGKECQAYEHAKNKPHPLDNARAYLATAQVGDTLLMRTYSVGVETTFAHADVVRHNRNFVTVRMFNTFYRVRRDAAQVASKWHHGGTVIGMEQWGVDTSAPITRGGVPREHPERAEGMLRSLRKGDTIRVIGYPPLDNQRKDAKVLTISAGTLTLRIGRRKVRMYRKGALAGITIDDVWVLDTTEESHASQADPAPQANALAEGHQPG